MEIYPIVYHLINILLQVILWSLIISSPAIILTLEMYGYHRVKKSRDNEVKEKEKIILGKSKVIVKQDEELQRQADERKRLEIDVDLLKKQKKALSDDLGLDEDPNNEKNTDDDIDVEQMNIIQLKEKAKEIGIKGYSRKNKKQLVKILKDNIS